MWVTYVILIIVVCYAFYQIDRRIKNLEEVRGAGYSHHISVNAFNAVFTHPKFGVATGIKSAIEGKKFQEWSKSDEEKWFKIYAKKTANKSSVTLTYLASENAYFINPHGSNSYIAFREHSTNLLYSAIVVGDYDGFKPHIEFLLYERLTKGVQGKYEWMLIPCLQYRDDHIIDIDKKHEFKALCEFPHFRDETKDEELQQLGFKVERRGGDDVYEDSFGDTQSVRTTIAYEKNGVEIRYIL